MSFIGVRIPPFFEIGYRSGRRRRTYTSSRTRLSGDVVHTADRASGMARSLVRRRIIGAVVALVLLGLAWLAKRREKHLKRHALALESAAVTSIRESQTVLTGQVTDPLTGALQADAPPMATPVMAHAVPVASVPQTVPDMAVSVQSCPTGAHALEPYAAQSSAHGCDVCSRAIQIGEQIWRCHACNFDKCASCAASGAEPPGSKGAPQPAAAAAAASASAPPAAAAAGVLAPEAELGGMRLSQLKARAAAMGADPRRLAAVDDEPDIRAATIALIVQLTPPEFQQQAPAGPGSPFLATPTASAPPAAAFAPAPSASAPFLPDCTTAHAPSAPLDGVPVATAWAAPAAPIPTTAGPTPMFNPSWAGGVVERVFVHLKGWVWAPDSALVRAPFSGESVVSYRSVVKQEYQVLVHYKHRRKVKSGRKKGSRGKDDPGSDSEYEEEERTRWERRSRTVWSEENAVGSVFIEDETGRVRFQPEGPTDAGSGENLRWAQGFHEEVFRDYQSSLPSSWREAMAGVAMSFLSSERTIGYRRTEGAVRRGMAFEGAGEMCVSRGALTLHKPSGIPGLRAIKDIGQGPVAGQDLSGMPLVAELRRQDTMGTPLAEKKKKGAKRWGKTTGNPMWHMAATT